MDREQFIEAFHQVADTPNGVEKLRGLILDLAVRGKLVPQDPSDEPASVLLERIKEEKARLVKEKKIKKSKPLPPITDDEIPFQVPEGWSWCRLSDVGSIIGGGTPKSGEPDFWSDNGIPWVTPADMKYKKGKYIERGRRDISQSGLERSSAQLLPPSSVLFSSRAPIGHVAIAKNTIATNQGFKSCRPYLLEMCNYIYNFMLYVGPIIDEQATGTTFKEVSGKDVSKVTFPLPPLAEQHRIVAKVDELMTLCDQLDEARQRREETRTALCISALDALMNAESEADLHAAWRRVSTHFTTVANHPEAVKSLRETILQLAVRGKLVPQDPSDEPASVLLERIKEEKARLVKEKKIKKSKPLPPINDDEIPFQVPEGWSWCRLGSLSYIKGGKRLPKGHTYAKGITKYRYIQVTNMKLGTIVDKPDVFITKETHNLIKDYTINSDDLYITIAGTIGKVGLVPLEYDGMNLTENAAKIRIINTNRHMIQNFMMSPFMQAQFTKKTKQQAQPKLAIKRIETSILPLPPLAEQDRIVAKVDELMALCDRLEQSLTQRHETALLLTESGTQGVLDAFSIDSEGSTAPPATESERASVQLSLF